jgi:acetylornithine deacetylase
MPAFRLPDTRVLLRELIALPSISCVNPAWDQSNLPVVEKLAEWCRTLGFHCEIVPIPGWPGKANLIATLGSGPGGLVLAGHTDTVPYDQHAWQHDPFSLVEADGRLYGLGTSDMKGFFALALTAAQGFAGQVLRRPLILLATADEESSMCGAQALVEAGKPLGRYAVIGEPTGLRPARLHKGIMMEGIRLIGKSGHSSNPALGNSALEGMNKVLSELLAWRAELQQKYRNPLFEVPFPTLNPGYIHGGDNPNRICGECELHIDLRTLPGMHLDELRETLRQRVGQAIQDSGLCLEIRDLFGGIEALETPAASAIVRAAEKLTGHAAGTVAFATEGPYFNQMGLETVILGPGDIAQAHQPDEFIALDRLQPTVDLLQGLIATFCLFGEDR